MQLKADYLLDGEHLNDPRKFNLGAWNQLEDADFNRGQWLGVWMSNEAQSLDNKDASGGDASPLVVDAECMDDNSEPDVLSTELEVPDDSEEVLEAPSTEPQDSTEPEANDIDFIEVEFV